MNSKNLFKIASLTAFFSISFLANTQVIANCKDIPFFRTQHDCEMRGGAVSGNIGRICPLLGLQKGGSKKAHEECLLQQKVWEDYWTKVCASCPSNNDEM